MGYSYEVENEYLYESENIQNTNYSKFIYSDTESDDSEPEDIFKPDFSYDASSIYTLTDERYTIDALFDSTLSTGFITGKDDYSGTGGAYAGTVTTNSYGGQWGQIDLGRQVKFPNLIDWLVKTKVKNLCIA